MRFSELAEGRMGEANSAKIGSRQPAQHQVQHILVAIEKVHRLCWVSGLVFATLKMSLTIVRRFDCESESVLS